MEPALTFPPWRLQERQHVIEKMSIMRGSYVIARNVITSLRALEDGQAQDGQLTYR